MSQEALKWTNLENPYKSVLFNQSIIQTTNIDNNEDTKPSDVIIRLVRLPDTT